MNPIMGDGFAMYLFLAVGSIALFSFISVAAWTDSRRREREAYYKSELLKKIAEMQGGPGNPALDLLREEERIAERRRREGIKLGGLITSGVGIGLMVFLQQIEPAQPVFLCGLIPLLIGVALLAYAYLPALRQ